MNSKANNRNITLEEIITTILATTWLNWWNKQPYGINTDLTNSAFVLSVNKKSQYPKCSDDAKKCLQVIESRRSLVIISSALLLILIICIFAHNTCKELLIRIQAEIGVSNAEFMTYMFPAIAVFVLFGGVFTLRSLRHLQFSPSTYLIGNEWKKALAQIKDSGLLKSLMDSITSDMHPKIKEALLSGTTNRVVKIDTNICNWLFNVYTEHVVTHQAREHVLQMTRRDSSGVDRSVTERAFRSVLGLGTIFKSTHNEIELRQLLYTKARNRLQHDSTF